MTNFTFLTSTPDFASFAGVAESAERLLHIDDAGIAFNIQRSMEFAGNWVYCGDEEVEVQH